MNNGEAGAPLAALLKRSDEFEAAIKDRFSGAGLQLADANLKHELVVAASQLSIEHSLVLRLAFLNGAPNSGAALLRLQNESLLRAAWLLFVATPARVAKLAAELDVEAEQAANGLPGYIDMLTAVVRRAPPGLSAPLQEFNQYSRHALNSYVHGGIHPLTRTRDGFPLELAITSIKFSNGLMHLAYRMLASFTGSQWRMDQVTQVYRQFEDCVPMAPSGTAN